MKNYFNGIICHTLNIFRTEIKGKMPLSPQTNEMKFQSNITHEYTYIVSVRLHPSLRSLDAKILR